MKVELAPEWWAATQKILDEKKGLCARRSAPREYHRRVGAVEHGRDTPESVFAG